ncbi:serine hydrolase domain-containing protein [Comamonas composti]|uniref:serine hydrolase domain-containing protein n=1 Tax=Comamonas composti TaxID=408558 RepID=UPI00040C71E8|nr:serine hydrolase domain-containing protein [Comamonas composti]
MKMNVRIALDAILAQTATRHGGVPGVVAMATDRDGNFYEGAAGTRELGRDLPMGTDAVFALFSTTKALTGTCIMQLVEEGLLTLEDEAGKYLPEIDRIEVLQGFDAQGQPVTRAPRRKITVNDLMLHTAGFSYEFFSADDLRYREAKGLPTVVSCSPESIRSVLLHDPGEAWSYGVNIDWLGLIVEKLRGKRLGAVMAERIFAPLGMQEIGFGMTDAMRARRVTIHDRAADGRLTPLPDLVLPEPPPMDMGGHGLYASVGEYMKFIRMILNDGAGPHGRVLKPETVQAMARDGLLPMGLSAGGWTGAIASLSNSGEFFAGTPKGWSYSFMTNREPTPSGRAAGSLMWAGLANCYYWIDKSTGIGGFWATQILPFQDAVSYPAFVEFESAIYHHLR